MKTNIMGTAVATVQQMQSYIQKVNPAVPKSVIDMVEYYISEGKTEGVRGDIAFAQSCLETGNFTFNGSAVTLDQNNFAGIGVTKNGMKGNSFSHPWIWFLSLYVLCFICTDIIVFGICFAIKLLVRC